MPPLDLYALPREDLAALAALKLMVEVGAETALAFETWGAADRWSCLDFLLSGAASVGTEPMDGRVLARARSWQAEVGRPARAAPPRASAGEAVATFAALAAHEADVWEEVSAVEAAVKAPRIPRKRPCRPDDVVVVPVPGFVATPDPWGAQLGVTLTQLTMA
jgi:hypothetical protein